MLPKKKRVQPDLDFECVIKSPGTPNEDIYSHFRLYCELLFVPHFD